MNTLLRTANFDSWLRKLTNLTAQAKIVVRLQRFEQGNFGDVKPLADGVFEMRIDIGPGYRVYYAREGRTVYLLLAGGDKSTQSRDIEFAKLLWMKAREERKN